MDCKHCSIGLELDQTVCFLCRIVFSNTLCSVLTFSIALICSDGVGMGTGTGVMRARVGMIYRGCVCTETGGDGVQFLSLCRPVQ